MARSAFKLSSAPDWRTADAREPGQRRTRAKEEFLASNSPARQAPLSRVPIQSGSSPACAVGLRDPVAVFAQLAHQRLGGALVRCEEIYPNTGAGTVLLVVVDSDPGQWRETLAFLHAQAFQSKQPVALTPPRLEIIDRSADDALRHLAAIGLIVDAGRVSRFLFAAEDAGGPTTLSAEEQAMAKAHRDHARRKLKMARVVGEAGFVDEACVALLDAIHALGRAFAVESRLPEPVSASEAVQRPLSSQWKDALPVIADFMRGSNPDWRTVAGQLAKV